MSRPFETEREAAAASLWATSGRHAGNMRTANLADLAAECGNAGVELGAYDRVIVERLATFEPSAVAVICSLISRACQAKGTIVLPSEMSDCLADMLADAIQYRSEGVASAVPGRGHPHRP